MKKGMNKDAVQNERQPRNTATIRPEALMNSEESERLLREGVAATVFNPNQTNKRKYYRVIIKSDCKIIFNFEISSSGVRHSQYNNYSLRNKLNSSIFDINHNNGTDYSLESPDQINSLIDENIFNNLSSSSKLNHLNSSSRKSFLMNSNNLQMNSNNLSNFVSNNGMINGNSSSMNSASTSSSSSSVTSFSSGYESSMQRKNPLENNDQFNLDTLFHPLLAESIYETSTKILFVTVKWTKSLPLFLNLNINDQVRCLLYMN